jgi:hypothetical protein
VFPHSSALRRGTYGLWPELERAARRLPIGGVVALVLDIAIDAVTSLRSIGPDLFDAPLMRTKMPEAMGLKLLEPSRLFLDHETLERPLGGATDANPFIRAQDGTRRTSVVLFLEKTHEPREDAVAELLYATRAMFEPEPLLPAMSTNERATRNGQTVTVPHDAPLGHFLYGPYVRLPAGKACLWFDVRVIKVASQETALEVDICIAGGAELARRAFSVEELQRTPWIEFFVPDDVAQWSGDGMPLEFRFTHHGNTSLEIRDLEVGARPPSEWERRIRGWRRWVGQRVVRANARLR